MSQTNILRLRAKFGIDDIEQQVITNTESIANIISGGGGGGGQDWGPAITVINQRLNGLDASVSNTDNNVNGLYNELGITNGNLSQAELRIHNTEIALSATTQRVATAENNIATLNQQVAALDTRTDTLEEFKMLATEQLNLHSFQIEGVTTVNTTQNGKIATLQGVNDQQDVAIANLTNRITSLETQMGAANLKLSYFVGQGMIGVGDVGGNNLNQTNLTVSGMIANATRVNFNNQTSSLLVFNWLDQGFAVMPIIVWFNDVDSTTPTTSTNNDMAPIWLHANSLTRTQCKVLLEETFGATQRVRLFVMFYRCDQNVLINTP